MKGMSLDGNSCSIPRIEFRARYSCYNLRKSALSLQKTALSGSLWISKQNRQENEFKSQIDTVTSGLKRSNQMNDPHKEGAEDMNLNTLSKTSWQEISQDFLKYDSASSSEDSTLDRKLRHSDLLIDAQYREKCLDFSFNRYIFVGPERPLGEWGFENSQSAEGKVSLYPRLSITNFFERRTFIFSNLVFLAPRFSIEIMLHNIACLESFYRI